MESVNTPEQQIPPTQQPVQTPTQIQTQTTPGQPPPIIPANQKKLPLLFIVLLLVVLGSIGIGVYFIVQSLAARKAANEKVNIPTPFVTPVPTFSFNSQELLYTKNNEIWTINILSKAKKKILTNTTPILDLAVSPAGELAAFTYLAQTNTTNPFAYPAGGLKIFNIGTGNIQELIPEGNLSIRYPTWSTDGKYLSIWVNEGSSALLFDAVTGKTVFEIYSVSQGTLPVSPITFIPRSEAVAYVSNNTLYERKLDEELSTTTIATNVKAVREVHEGPALPDVPHYSPDGITVAYHTLTGNLIMLNKKTTQKKELANGEVSELDPNSYQAVGYVLGFNSLNDLIFFKYDDTYQYGKPAQKPPFYLYSDVLATPSAFLKETPPGDIDFNSLVFSPDSKKVVAHSTYAGEGFVVYSENGTMLQNCFTVDFRYDFYNWGGGPNYQSRTKVWSSDNIYLVSQKETLAIIDTRNCQVFDTFGETGVKNAVWLP